MEQVIEKLDIIFSQKLKLNYRQFYSNAKWFLSRKFNKFNHYVNTEVTLLIAEYRNALEVNVNESNNPPKSVEINNEDNDWLENNYFDYL